MPHLTFLSPLTNVLYTAVSWVLLRWHQLFTALGMDPKGGFTWALSIVFLVITARVLLFRFFIKQVHYTRQMQKLAPEIAKLKEKHKGDRQAQQQAMMQLQQDQGLNFPSTGSARERPRARPPRPSSARHRSPVRSTTRRPRSQRSAAT